MLTQRSRRILHTTYSCLVGAVGWAAVAWVINTQGISTSFVAILFFILLSASSKRLGIKVVEGVTYSLVGVVDLAALYIFGPSTALLVAAASSALSHLLDLLPPAPKRTTYYLRQAFFNSGLNALMVLASFSIYHAAGGQVPLVVSDWVSLLPVLAASVCWFAVDHLGWAITRLPFGGVPAAVEFLRRILRYSLLFELLPLPIAVLISSTYEQLSAALLIIITAVFLGLGIIIRQLVSTLELERRRSREESILGEMGRRFLQAGMELDPICKFIGEFSYRILPNPVYIIQLDCRDWGCEILPMVLLDGKIDKDASQAFSKTSPGWFTSLRQPLLVSDFQQQQLVKPLECGSPARSGIYVPIIADDQVVGVIGAQHPEPAALSNDDMETLQLVAAQAALGLRGAHLYRQQQQRSVQLTTIAEVSRKVAAILDLDTLFKDSVTLIKESFGYYCVSLFTTDETNASIHFEASSSPAIQQRGIVVPWGKGIIGNAASTGVSVLASDVRQDSRFLPDSILDETHAELAIPMKVENRILGVLDLQSDRTDAFSQQDAVVLQALADQIAIAVEDSRIYYEQQAQTWVSTALLQVAETLAELTTAEDILSSVARLTLMLGGVHCCLIFLWSEEKQEFTAIEFAGLSTPKSGALRNQRFSLDAIPLLARVYRERKLIKSQPQEIMPYLPPIALAFKDCADVLALPLRSKGELVGVMVAAEPVGEARLAVHRQNILLGIANHTALALDNAKLYASQAQEAWISAALLQVANTITVSRSLEEITSIVVRLTPLLAGVDWCALLLWDEDNHAFYVARSSGLPHDVRDIADGRYFSSKVLGIEQRTANGAEQFPLRLPVEGWQALGASTAWPLRSHDELLGLLLVGSLTQNPLNGRRGDIVAGIANQAALAVETYQLYQRRLEQQRLERGLELAHEIQQGFLPETCPQIEGWDIAAEWRAARGVGGDYYDFLRLDQTHTGFVIGDVADKGIAAALYMALARAVVRAAALGMLGPAEALTRANRILLEDSRSGMFVSLFYAILETRSGKLQYGRAGHNPPYVWHAGTKSIEQLAAPGTVLGITDTPRIDQETVSMEAGDILVMYTDGVTEAVNDHNEEFGEARLREVISQAADLTAGEVLERIDSAVSAHCGEQEQFDDLTLVVVKRA
ncbi:MAG: SpoIIE family protein phosphatase [Anaerolineae bacterium]